MIIHDIFIYTSVLCLTLSLSLSCLRLSLSLSPSLPPSLPLSPRFKNVSTCCCSVACTVKSSYLQSVLSWFGLFHIRTHVFSYMLTTLIYFASVSGLTCSSWLFYQPRSSWWQSHCASECTAAISRRKKMCKCKFSAPT